MHVSRGDQTQRWDPNSHIFHVEQPIKSPALSPDAPGVLEGFTRSLIGGLSGR